MRRAALAIAALLFTGCYQVTDYPKQPPTLTRCELTDVHLHIRWVVDVDEAAKACARESLTYGCTEKILYLEGVRHAYLVLPRPRDFNDVPLIATLGHETCHALGGTHQ